MLKLNKRLTGTLLGLSLALSALTPAFADDTEIYVGAVSTVNPNILLIIDTSYSMDTTDATDDHPTFNPGSTYGTVSGCDDTKIFYTVGLNQTPPTCSSTNYISSNTSTYQFCSMLAAATGTSGPSGRWTGKTAQYDTVTKTWGDLQPSGSYGAVECMADRGTNGGPTNTTTNVYARNGSSTNAWTSSVASEINWQQRTTYTFYSARWVKWNAQTPGTYTMSRIQAMKNAVNDMVSSIDGVNVGVMRFNGQNGSASGDAQFQGGVVIKHVQDVTTTRNAIISAVNGMSTNSATPLSETLHEAYLYWAGKTPEWGNNGSMDSAAKGSDNNYVSPMTQACQRNFNIILTDGRPTWDNQDDADIQSLYGSACTGQPGDPNSGPSTPPAPNTPANAGRCLDEMSTYMARNGTDLSSTLDGEQHVKTFTVGFGGNDPAAFDFLQEVANDGGGQRYLATNVASLNAALTSIVTEISNVSSTFATASIGVNSFNRASTRDELYFAVFNSDDHLRWDGNLKKYKLQVYDPDGSGPIQPKLIIAGTAVGQDAIDSATGFFKDGIQSFWSSVVDGKNVLLGGAASKLPTTRNVYTHIGSNPAGTAANLISITSSAVDDTQLGTTTTSNPNRAQVLAFATDSTNKRMGDPLHSQPAVVTYSGTATSPVDVVYMATNDGYLHAVDASTGIEKWAFVPQELLPRLQQLVADPAATTRSYGLDGDIRILKLDYNGDGDVDTADGDLVYLFFGMRRGGRYMYGLNVTDPNSPKLLWKDGPSLLKDVGETWSAPTLARINVGGASQNAQKIVLVFGGGYDGSQENYTQVADPTGNNIWMVDAKSGALLWSAGATSTSTAPHDMTLAAMTNSIPGRVQVLDIDGDGYADRMYAADTGGRIFRFDIFNGATPSSLVTGSVFAAMGNGAVAGGNNSPSPNSATRRFYNAPDVTLIQRRGQAPYYNLAIGSGYRGHPLYRNNLDRFYSLRDKQPYAKYSTNNAITPLTDASTGIVDITSDPVNAAVGPSADGWKLIFDPTNTQTGEKVLNEATTVNGVILFSTYAPLAASTTDPCQPTSSNKVYAVRADNGHPALDVNSDGNITNSDLSQSVVHQGILGGVNVGVLRGPLADAYNAALLASSSSSSSSSSGGGQSGDDTICLAGMHVLGRCVKVGDSVRTYWRKDID